jgi:hypothetical protein
MKASIRIAFQDIPSANTEEGRGQGGYGNMDSISRKTAPVTDSGFAKRVTGRRLRSPTVGFVVVATLLILSPDPFFSARTPTHLRRIAKPTRKSKMRSNSGDQRDP